jgi:hypothetical protein
MSEIDRVFARFQDTRTPTSDRREVRTVPGRGTRGSRVVEVVHLRSAGPSAGAAGQPRQGRAHRLAASWDEGFPARQAPTPPAPEPAPAAATVEPTAHVMPAWEPSAAPEPDAEPVPAVPPPRARRPRGRTAAMERPVADPFDAADEGANCLRCGYLVEKQREARGLMTCAACG